MTDINDRVGQRQRMAEAIATWLRVHADESWSADNEALLALVDRLLRSGVHDLCVPLDDLSRALDEIWHLRRALAYEAAVNEAHLQLKTFPKSRRQIVLGQIERMREAARGAVLRAYAGLHTQSIDGAMDRAGAEPTLTRGQWERQQ